MNSYATRLVLLLPVLLLLATCKDGTGPTPPTQVLPSALAISLPETIVQGQPFSLTVSALTAAGQPDPVFRGTVNLTASAGTLTPGSVELTQGIATAQVNLSGAAGEVEITARMGTVSTSSRTLALSGEPAVRLEVIPASFLLTAAGESRQLAVRGLDAQGQPAMVSDVTWRSTNPDAISISEAGVVTAVTGLGSGQIIAEANGVRSAPVLGLIARPRGGVVNASPSALSTGASTTVQGALLVDDSQVVGVIAPADPNAPYEMGWRYRVRLRGVTPSIGQLVLGTESAPIGGRVVAVQPDGNESVVTLELIPIEEMFEEIPAINESISLDDAEVIVAEGINAQMVPGRPRSTVFSFNNVRVFATGDSRPASELAFPLLGMKCKLTTSGASISVAPIVLEHITFDLERNLTWDIAYDRGLKSVVRGRVDARLNARPVIKAALDGKVGCKAEVFRILLPLGGPLALLVGGQVPLGVGFNAGVKLSVGDVGVDLFTDAVANVTMGPDCTGGGDCNWIFDAGGSASGYARPILPEMSSSSIREEFSFSGFVFAELRFGLATRFIHDAGFSPIEVTAGLQQTANLATARGQADDPRYASAFKLAAVIEYGTTAQLQSLLNLLRINLAGFRDEIRFDLARSPTGTFTIEPARVRAGTDTEPGELATFKVILSPTDYAGLDVIDGVEFYWRKTDSNGGSTLEPLGGLACQPRSGGTFTCTRFFTEEHEGEQTFYAFVKPKIFGVPVPVPLEVAADGKASVTVTTDSIQVAVNPPAVTLETNESYQFTATVTGTDNTEVTWGARWGRIDSRGLYVAPGFATADTVHATSVADPSATGRAVVVVTDSECTQDCGDGPDPGDTDPNGDGSGSSYGDPHLITLDGRPYDFHAVGDFILAKSTTAGDPFEVQVRYRRPNVSEAYSWNHAVAMNVLGDVVNVYGVVSGIPDIVINGQEINEQDGLNLVLPNGGAVSISGTTITVSWPDRTMVEVIPASWEPEVLGWVKVFLPRERRKNVEGLLGNFDGDRSNDLRIRGGAVLNNPTVAELYLDFRRSWNVPANSPNNLFRRKVENFDPTFPPNIVTINDLPPADIALAREVCRSAGSLHPAILDACILDVVLTGDERWAQIAAGVDPRIPGVTVLPRHSSLDPGESRQFGALVTGTTNRRVIWTASGGSIREDADNLITYTAPGAGGAYTLTATLAENGSVSSSARVNVICSGEERTFGDGATLSGSLPNVKITGNVMVAGPTSVCGNLVISGAGARLTLGGQQVTVHGEFRTEHSGTLSMVNAADRLTVSGEANFIGGSTEGTLSAGEIRVAGDWMAHNLATSFAPTGTRVVLDGTTPQRVFLSFTSPTDQRFLDLEITNPAGVNFASNVQINGTVTVAAGSGNVTGPGTATIGGNLVDQGHRWRVANTIFTGSPNLPAQMTSNLTLRGAVTLTRDLALTGNLFVQGGNGNLTLAGRQVSVSGDFNTVQGGILTMTNSADRLTVSGEANFIGGSSEGTLSAGEIRVAGDWMAHNLATSFAPTGTRVVLDGTTPQRVFLSFTSPTDQRFLDLEITNPAGVNFASNVQINGNLDLKGRLTVPSGGTVRGIQRLFLRSTSVLTNQGTIQTAACTKEVGHTINGTDPCP